jgi:predicted CDP-diglyceride synthetase/phosphatidate cytidylyltransferase
MKFIHYLEKVSRIDWYGMVSLTIFVLFFLVMTTWVLKTNKKQFDEASRLPLDN